MMFLIKTSVWLSYLLPSGPFGIGETVMHSRNKYSLLEYFLRQRTSYFTGTTAAVLYRELINKTKQ